MTSQEADRFMLAHPEVAVRAFFDSLGSWIAWDRREPEMSGLQSAIGYTREGAISEYKRIYHPEKPRPGYENVDAASKTFADSAKYRRIVEEYKTCQATAGLEKNLDVASSYFKSKVATIIFDDLYPTHCDKCKQELK